MKAMDNGKFVLGAPHGDGEGPDPEEIVMAMRVGGEGGGGSDPIKRPVHSSLTMVFWWWGDLLWGDLLELGRPPRTPLVPHCSARRCM